MGSGGAKAVLVGGSYSNVNETALGRLEAKATCSVQGHGLPAAGAVNTARLHHQGLDGAVSLGTDGGHHGLARQGRRAGSGGNEHFRGVGLCLGHHTQCEGFAVGVKSVMDPGGNDKVAHLAGAGGPDQLLGCCIVTGAFRQVAKAYREGLGLGLAVFVPSIDSSCAGQTCSFCT